MTMWLGLRLVLRTGKQAAVRLALISAAVAVGVAVLLSTLAAFQAFQTTAQRPCWECTTGTAPSGWALGATTNTALWNLRTDTYRGRSIKRLDVAALGAQAPAVPGLSRLPGPGQFAVSPALAELLRTVPSDQLGDRFPGTQAAVIGRAALSGPDELVIVVGRTPQQVAALVGTVEVDAVATQPAASSTTDLYQQGFAVAAVGLIFPLLVLIATASRLAAARREERLAAIRLVGATNRQISVIASVEAAVGAVAGTLAGVVIFQLVRPALANMTITGARFFPDVLAPSLPQYAAVVAGVPLAACVAALWSLRRVRVTPLGVARKAAAPAPGLWRIVPLLAGLGLFAGPVFAGEGNDPNAVLVDAGLVLIMVGLVVAGPWLTMGAARLSARFTGSPATLLAARRLSADPKTAFRSVTGIVLAVFIGTAIAGIIPAVIAGQRAAGDGTLNQVLRVTFAQGSTPNGEPLSAQEGEQLLERLRAYGTVLPIYDKPGDVGPPTGPPGPEGPPPEHLVGCDSLTRFPALGRCQPGQQAVEVTFMRLLTSDNMLTIARELPYVDAHSPASTTTLSGLGLSGVLVAADDPVAVERARTLLAGYLARSGATETPLTFAEVAQARAILYDTVQQLALAIVALTLLVAGCSLVVAVGGGLLERRQSFTLLRLSGTPVRTLGRVVLLESAVPLLLAAVLAAVAGFGVAQPVIDQLRIKGASAALPGLGYFATVGGGLIACLLVLLTGLPLLKRMTSPDNARFE